MTRLPRLLAVLAAGGLTAGCATTAVQMQPSLAYARQDCDAAPNLAGAISLTSPKEQVSFVVNTAVNTATPCLVSDGKAGPYLVYALPAEYADKTINAGGMLELVRIFAPQISVLDESGKVTRTFAAQDFYHRSTAYSVQFTPRPTERYLLVTSAPDLVGKRYDSVFIGTSTTTIVAGGYASNWTSGVDHTQSRVFAYDGMVQVTVYDTDAKKK